jgi:lipopolysaccharide/colanic/teichoic acid biosynthesis glycosyltransferase
VTAVSRPGGRPGRHERSSASSAVPATGIDALQGGPPDGAHPGAEASAISPWARSPLKRGLDVAVALPLAIVTLPLLGVLCAVSAVVFRANPVFTQDRIGHDGRIFRFVKLRSLPVSVPSDIDKYALADRPLGRWARFVRRSHLDELPQLWLVVAGQMSLVGPRPELPAIAATFDPDFVRRRVRVRPGVTGPWQVGTGASGLIGESPEFDDLYVTAATLRMDLWVMARTVVGSLGASPASLEACAQAARR